MDRPPDLSSVTPAVSPGNYNPVTITVNDSTGAVCLGILAVVLLIALLRSERRQRATLAQMAGAR